MFDHDTDLSPKVVSLKITQWPLRSLAFRLSMRRIQLTILFCFPSCYHTLSQWLHVPSLFSCPDTAACPKQQIIGHSSKLSKNTFIWITYDFPDVALTLWRVSCVSYGIMDRSTTSQTLTAAGIGVLLLRWPEQALCYLVSAWRAVNKRRKNIRKSFGCWNICCRRENMNIKVPLIFSNLLLILRFVLWMGHQVIKLPFLPIKNLGKSWRTLPPQIFAAKATNLWEERHKLLPGAADIVSRKL